MAISLADIAAKAGTYPAYARDFGRTLSKLAESIVAHVASAADVLAPSKVTIPSATTVELDAIDDASVGDLYIDSDLGLLVVFTAAAVYAVVGDQASA